jgi:surfactin synthase thioesterase subunit
MIETYESREPFPPLRSEFFVWTGSEDPWTRSRIGAWTPLTSGGCHYREFGGGHFFLYERTAEVVAELNRSLLPFAASMPV